LTLAFNNPGARESFTSGGSDEILRQAALDLLGVDWKIETAVDGGAAPTTGAARTIRREAPSMEEEDSESDSEVVTMDGAELLQEKLGAVVIEETSREGDR